MLKDITDALTSGKNCILIVSRTVIDVARKKFNGENVTVLPIYILAKPELIKERLIKRRRESIESIQKRIDREFLMEKLKRPANAVIVYNNGTIEEGVREFVKTLTQCN